VEDNVVNQRIAATVLGKRGHLITIANDGNEGVAAAFREDFDVILMDVQMPGMNGWEATAAIRAHERDSGGHVPIIAMTAHAFKEDIDRCTAVGMDGYVSKPFEIKALLNELARVRTTQDAGGALIRFAQAITDSQPNASVQQLGVLDQ
jgi:two-component system sensor histidine kinase/response regulator